MLLDAISFLHVTWVDILDILMVAAIIYLIFQWIKGSSAMNIFVAIIILLIVRVVAASIGMKMISSLLGTIIDVGAVAIIVIFQPEIRRFLNSIGRSAGSTIEKNGLLKIILPRRSTASLEMMSVDEIAEACKEMSEQKTGALIVIRRGSQMEDIISTGDILDARISKRMIMNIFFKNSPLHDGAMIIGANRIIAARCTLPITDRLDLPARYGMRHKAAVGLSEQTDADIIVVSEQTGGISFVHRGKVTSLVSINTLKHKLQRRTENKEAGSK